MTGPEIHAYLVRLGMEAWDRTLPDSYPEVRVRYEAALRERMSQAARVIALEMEPRK